MSNIRTLLAFGIIGFFVFSEIHVGAQGKKTIQQRPNIIFIMTDDQGYGDFGFTGNPYVKTPNIDKLADRSTRLTNYHHSPVCAPTRASLMTGRYHQRTGVHDTYNNGAIMASSEKTLAEILVDAGYKTAIAGKWHLGENYGHRPPEQGFQYSLIHHGGGIGQPGDPIENFVRTDSSYFDPVLFENNKPVKSKGYCSDIFTDAGIKFISENKSNPFFLYLSFNAPHTPLQVPQRYYDLYKDIRFDTPGVKEASLAKMTDKDKEDARRVYAMITNIDDNVGKLLAAVKSQGLENNTIIIFTTDNGNQQTRFNAGLKGLKSTVYEGGTRVVNLVSGKGIVPENKEQNALLGHVDMLPTILEATSIDQPQELKLDGESAWQIILGKKQQRNSRSFYNAWARGYPEPYRNAAFYRGDYKLVANNADGNDINTFELYDLNKDPFEQTNMISSRPDLAATLKKGMDSVFTDFSPNENLKPQRIQLGTAYENPVTLTRQDLAGIGAKDWNTDVAVGVWTISIAQDGYYDFKLINIKPIQKGVRALVRLGQIQRSVIVSKAESTISISRVFIKKGDYDIESWYEQDNKLTTPYYLEVFKEP